MATLDLKHLVVLTLQVSIFCTVFGFGLKLALEDFLCLVRRPGLFARSLVALFVVMPIVAVLLVQLFGLRHVVGVALIAIAISPVPPLLPRRESNASGAASYAMVLMAALAFASIVVVPMSVGVLERLFARPLEMAPSAVARIAFVSMVAPLGAGMLVRALASGAAAAIEPVVSRVSQVLLGMGVLALLGGTASAVLALVGDGTLAAMAVFVLTGLAVGHVLGGADPRQQVVLALSSACRHPAMAVSIAAANFPDEQFGPAIILYLLLNIVLCAPYLTWQKRRIGLAV